LLGSRQNSVNVPVVVNCCLFLHKARIDAVCKYNYKLDPEAVAQSFDGWLKGF